jgi:ketosteroid isomerase-like protein
MKTSMEILLVLVVGVCGCAGPRPAGEAGADSSLVSIVEVEDSFGRAAEDKGMRAAFLEYLADDGIIFRPAPVNGKEWFLEQPDTPGTLSWRPAYAEVSRSDDLGYTTGPWEFRQELGEKGIATYGDYVSIWRRDTGGRWRLLVEFDVAHNRPSSVSSKVQFGPGAAPDPQSVPRVDVEAEVGMLLTMDREFSANSASFGTIAAYMSFSADDIRFYRMDASPAVGKNGVRKTILEEPGLWTWEPDGGGVSRGGHLGYTYGSAEFVKCEVFEGKILMPVLEGAETEHRSYLRIWRKNGTGNWSIALDMAIPLPPSGGKAEQ